MGRDDRLREQAEALVGFSPALGGEEERLVGVARGLCPRLREQLLEREVDEHHAHRRVAFVPRQPVQPLVHRSRAIEVAGPLEHPGEVRARTLLERQGRRAVLEGERASHQSDVDAGAAREVASCRECERRRKQRRIPDALGAFDRETRAAAGFLLRLVVERRREPDLDLRLQPWIAFGLPERVDEELARPLEVLLVELQGELHRDARPLRSARRRRQCPLEQLPGVRGRARDEVMIGGGDATAAHVGFGSRRREPGGCLGQVTRRSGGAARRGCERGLLERGCDRRVRAPPPRLPRGARAPPGRRRPRPAAGARHAARRGSPRRS